MRMRIRKGFLRLFNAFYSRMVRADLTNSDLLRQMNELEQLLRVQRLRRQEERALLQLRGL